MGVQSMLGTIGMALVVLVWCGGVRADQAARGWLQLGQDQREARRQAEPLTPQESRQLQIREHQEALRLRETLQAQRRRAWDRVPRWAGKTHRAPPGYEVRRFGEELRQGRELEALRLRQGLDRRIQGTPPGRSRVR